MKKLTSLALFFLFSLQGFASEGIHLKALEKSLELLEPREDAISLEQAKEMAAGESIDARVAYEQLYQAQNRIHQARANYFPYGTGEILALYLTNFWNPLILAELVTSIPSKYFNVKKEYHLRNAQMHTHAALKENVKNQVAHMYFNILKEEAVISLAEYEVLMLEELVRALEIQVKAGVADAKKLSDVEYQALKKRDELLRFTSYLGEEKTALKMLLNMSFDEKKLVFQPVKNFLKHEDFSINPENLTLTALNRSNEVKAAQEMIYAASNSKRSTKWSILSFSGLGLDYMQRVRFAGSKLNQAIMGKKAVELNIENEVYSKENALRKSIDFMLSEKSIMENTKAHMLAQLESFKAERITIDELIEANLYYISDFRQTIIAHYNSLGSLDDLERIALGNVNSSMSASFDPQVVRNEHRGNLELAIDQSFDAIEEIGSVTYSFKNPGLNDLKSFSTQDLFSVNVRDGKFQYPLEGTALIIFKNGEVLKKTFVINQN